MYLSGKKYFPDSFSLAASVARYYTGYTGKDCNLADNAHFNRIPCKRIKRINGMITIYRYMEICPENSQVSDTRFLNNVFL